MTLCLSKQRGLTLANGGNTYTYRGQGGRMRRSTYTSYANNPSHSLSHSKNKCIVEGCIYKIHKGNKCFTHWFKAVKGDVPK